AVTVGDCARRSAGQPAMGANWPHEVSTRNTQESPVSSICPGDVRRLTFCKHTAIVVCGAETLAGRILASMEMRSSSGFGSIAADGRAPGEEPITAAARSQLPARPPPCAERARCRWCVLLSVAARVSLMTGPRNWYLF